MYTLYTCHRYSTVLAVCHISPSSSGAHPLHRPLHWRYEHVGELSTRSICWRLGAPWLQGQLTCWKLPRFFGGVNVNTIEGDTQLGMSRISILGVLLSLGGLQGWRIPHLSASPIDKVEHFGGHWSTQSLSGPVVWAAPWWCPLGP